MDYSKKFEKEGLTFDDVLLIPAKSDVLPTLKGTDMENMFNTHRPYTIFVEPKMVNVPENFSSDGTGESLVIDIRCPVSYSMDDIVSYLSLSSYGITKP